MIKAVKLCGCLAFIGFLVVVATSLAFYHLVRVGDFRRFLISQLEQQTELRLQLGEADLEIGTILGVSFRDLALAEPGRHQPEIVAERITARVALKPLLQRQLIFYEIRLYNPKIRLSREAGGRIPLLEKLLEFSSLKQEQTGVALDLRTVKVDGGEVFFDDQEGKKNALPTRVRGIELDIEFLRGERLRDRIREQFQPKQARPHGAALEFAFKGVVERSGQWGALRVNGSMMFPPGSRDYRAAWWSAQIDSADWPAELFFAFTGNRLPVESVNGLLTPRFQIDRQPGGTLRIKGHVVFARLGVDAPAVFATSLAPGDGRVEFDLDWGASRLAVHRLDLQSDEIAFALAGGIEAFDSSDPLFQLTVAVPSTSVVHLRRYLPLQAISFSPVEYGLSMFEQGEVQLNELELRGRASELSRRAPLDLRRSIRFEALLQNVSVRRLGNGYLPLRNLEARVRFEQGVFFLTDIKGSYGRSFLKNGHGKYEPLNSGGANLELRLTGDVDLTQLPDQLNAGFFPDQLAGFASTIQEIGGKGQLNLSLQRKANTPLQFEAKVGVQEGWLRLEEFHLTELKGDLFFTPKELRAENVRAVMGGGAIQARLSVKDHDSDGGSFDFIAESAGVKAGLVSSLLLSSGSLDDPGIVRGWMRYQGALARQEERKFTAALDLFNVRLALQPLLQPVRELSGRVVVDERGIDFQGLKGLFVGSPAQFSGRWRFDGKPQLTFDFSAPHMDVSQVLSQLDTDASDFYGNFAAAGRVTLGKGRLETFEFADLKSALAIEGRMWRLTQLTARSSSGVVLGTATIADHPEAFGFTVEPIVQGVPVRNLLDWFDAGEIDITGRAHLTGQFQSIGRNGPERKKNLNGSFKLAIEDGTIGRLRVIVQILNLLDLSRWFTLQMPDLTSKGIRFRSITGDFKVTDGVYSTQNLFVDSDDLRMTGEGRIDVVGDQIDFIVAVRPFAGIDSVINHIPLIGRSIAAIKNSILVASFTIRGPIDNPIITPAPLSTLSEVFLGVLGIPGAIIGLKGETAVQ